MNNLPKIILTASGILISSYFTSQAKEKEYVSPFDLNAKPDTVIVATEENMNSGLWPLLTNIKKYKGAFKGYNFSDLVKDISKYNPHIENINIIQSGISVDIPPLKSKLDTSKLDSSVINTTTKITKDPIDFFTQKNDSVLSKFFKQSEYISSLNNNLENIYKAAGDTSTLKDDNTLDLSKAVKSFDNTLKVSLKDSLYQSIEDSLSNILESRENFNKGYINLVERINPTFSNSITNLGELLKGEHTLRNRLDSLVYAKPKNLGFEDYSISFENLTLDKKILSNENKSIKKFTNSYLPIIKNQKRAINKTGMGDEVLINQKQDLASLAEFYKNKRDVLDEARNKFKIEDKNLVDKQIKLIDNMLEDIADIISPKKEKPHINLPSLKPVTIFNGLETGVAYFPGTTGQLLQQDIDGFTPTVGFNILKAGNFSLTVGAGYKTNINKGLEECTSEPDTVTGIKGYSKWKWNDFGSFQVSYADVSIPLSKNLVLNLGALGTSEDHKPSGNVDEGIIVPGISNPIIQNSYTHTPETPIGNKIYNTLGLKLNFGKVDAKAKLLLNKKEKPNYQFTIGYNIRGK